MAPIKVLVVDDHPLVRRGVVEVLAEQAGLVVVGEASNGAEALDKARELAPDVVLMDLQMPVMNGLEATRALQAQMPQAHILVLTISEKEADLFSAIRSGAKGYLLKNTGADELVRAIAHVAEGGVIVSPDMAAKLLSELAGAAQPTPVREDQLSDREAEVLRLVAQRSSNKEIATALMISENTVKTHLRSILEKLHVANRRQAAAYADRVGLRSPEPPSGG